MLSERLLVQISRLQLGLAIFACLLIAPLSANMAKAELVAGLLMAANYWGLRVLTARVLGGSRGKAKVAYAVMLALKQILVMAALAVLILVIRLDGIGVAIGIATLVLSIMLVTIRAAAAPS